MNLGIDPNTHELFEGAEGYGNLLWPVPIVTFAEFRSSHDHVMRPDRPLRMEDAPFIFREHTFDAITRVRRGCFYQQAATNPMPWQIEQHPFSQEVGSRSIHRTVEKQLATFTSFPLMKHFEASGISNPLVILGSPSAFTIWTVVNVEAIQGHDELVTIRSRETFGALPGLYGHESTDAHRGVLDTVRKLERDIHSASPESIIDRSRECAAAVLRVLLDRHGIAGPDKDLSKLISASEQLADYSKGSAVTASARIINRLHSRGKGSEQGRRPTRPIHERDAELAVQCLAFLLVDLDLAQWG